MSEYLEDVQRYDPQANPAVVDRIVKHLGIALRARDSSLVSCSDPSELARVREKWCEKKLGIASEAAGAEVVAMVCEQMRDDKNKNRVTFYYLVAKHFGKLSDL